MQSITILCHNSQGVIILCSIHKVFLKNFNTFNRVLICSLKVFYQQTRLEFTLDINQIHVWFLFLILYWLILYAPYLRYCPSELNHTLHVECTYNEVMRRVFFFFGLFIYQTNVKIVSVSQLLTLFLTVV